VCALVGLGANILMVALIFAFSYLSGNQEAMNLGPINVPAAGRVLLLVTMMLILVPLQAAGEEYMTRGWFVQALGSVFASPWPGIALGGLFFAAAHIPSTPWGWADLMVGSAILGWLTIRTGGLEAAIGQHVLNNLPIFILQAVIGGLEPAVPVDDSSAGDAPWPVFAANLIVVPLYALVITYLHRRTHQINTTPAAINLSPVPTAVV
jgi:membrane protease YdiL (CAAX protease family)